MKAFFPTFPYSSFIIILPFGAIAYKELSPLATQITGMCGIRKKQEYWEDAGAVAAGLVHVTIPGVLKSCLFQCLIIHCYFYLKKVRETGTSCYTRLVVRFE
jgi:hypothetical protein